MTVWNRLIIELTTDLVAFSIETYSSRRGYHIAARFRASAGIPVVLGGYHATLCPEETKEHADQYASAKRNRSGRRFFKTRTRTTESILPGGPSRPLQGLNRIAAFSREKTICPWRWWKPAAGVRFNAIFAQLARSFKALTAAVRSGNRRGTAPRSRQIRLFRR